MHEEEQLTQDELTVENFFSTLEEPSKIKKILMKEIVLMTEITLMTEELI